MQTQSKLIDAQALAQIWGVPESWIRNNTRDRAADPIPHYKFGRYVKFDPEAQELSDWMQRRMKGVGKRKPQ